MKHGTRGWFIAAMCAVFLPARAAGPSTNLELRELRNRDQAERTGSVEASDLTKVSARDTERRRHVVEILHSGGIRTAEDFFNAALISQHGETADEIRMAYSLARIAVQLKPDDREAKWLSAAAWDRLMMDGQVAVVRHPVQEVGHDRKVGALHDR